MSEKFCVNCKHYRIAREQPAGSEHRCNRAVFDLVTGKETKLDVICHIERGGLINTCGREGQFWEAMGSSEGFSKSDQRSG
jgi:hypothetical protein